MAKERSFHIIYQLLSGACPELTEAFQVSPNAGMYKFVNQGLVKLDDHDDGERMRGTMKALDTIGVGEEQQLELFRAIVAAVLFGNTEWKQRPKEDQAELEGETDLFEKIARLLGVESADLLRGLTRPKVKVRVQTYKRNFPTFFVPFKLKQSMMDLIWSFFYNLEFLEMSLLSERIHKGRTRKIEQKELDRPFCKYLISYKIVDCIGLSSISLIQFKTQNVRSTNNKFQDRV